MFKCYVAKKYVLDGKTSQCRERSLFKLVGTAWT